MESRRKFLKGRFMSPIQPRSWRPQIPALLVASLVVSAALMACKSGGGSPGASSVQQMEPQTGGHFKHPFNISIDTLNPYKTANGMIHYWTHEGLLEYEFLGYLDTPDAGGGQFEQ